MRFCLFFGGVQIETHFEDSVVSHVFPVKFPRMATDEVTTKVTKRTSDVLARKAVYDTVGFVSNISKCQLGEFI